MDPFSILPIEQRTSMRLNTWLKKGFVFIASARLKHIALETPSFDVTFNHIGIFGGGRVLFIAPDASHAMLQLKEAFGSSDNWTAHTTMLIDEPDTIRAALPVLIDGFSAFRGRVTQLHLYEFQPPRHILTVQLAGDHTC